jgi:zinc transporter ZupT
MKKAHTLLSAFVNPKFAIALCRICYEFIARVHCQEDVSRDLHAFEAPSPFAHLCKRTMQGQAYFAECFPLAGLALFYGLERMVKVAPKQQSERPGQVRPVDRILWIHISAFAVYNFLLGYLLLHRELPGLRSLVIYTVAIGLHFFVNDYGLSESDKEGYEARGRWAIALAVVLGWLAGLVIELNEALISLITAFLAGGIILNVLKEELPEERQSSFWVFTTGIAGYGLLLLLSS